MPTVLYRATDSYRFQRSYEIEVYIFFESFNVISETEKSYLIDYYGDTKRVLKASNRSQKRFAYLTKELALEDLRIRRSCELQHLKNRISNIEQGIEYLKTYKIGDPPVKGYTELVEYDW